MRRCGALLPGRTKQGFLQHQQDGVDSQPGRKVEGRPGRQPGAVVVVARGQGGQRRGGRGELNRPPRQVTAQ